MMSEVDNLSSSYEDMQAQNKRLLNDLGQKEDHTSQVASEVGESLLFCTLFTVLTGNACETPTCHGGN